MFEHILSRYGTLLRLHLSLLTSCQNHSTVFPVYTWRQCQRFPRWTPCLFKTKNNKKKRKTKLKLRGNNQFEGFLFLFSAYVCFYFFVKQKRCLILEAISDRFYLRIKKSCNFVKWALLLKYIKYLSILILRMIFFCKILYLPHCCYYTPGEYFFL